MIEQIPLIILSGLIGASILLIPSTIVWLIVEALCRVYDQIATKG